jgi:hypothetical protein
MTCARGCDLEPKTWAEGEVVYSPGRRLTAFIRWCFMHPADQREVDEREGAFMMSHPPAPFKPAAFEHLPQHWYGHVMHALEVIGYRHPQQEVAAVAYMMYAKMVDNLHLVPETKTQMIARLSEDRFAKNPGPEWLLTPLT